MKIPKEVLVWKFGNVTNKLKSNNNYENNQGYNLTCATNKQYLIWKKGMLSINLQYSSEVQNKYHFQVPDNKQREILTGEPVAMAIGMGEAFLYYGKQRFGINLKWSTTPLYQWRIYTASGEKNEKIRAGTVCALVNVEVDPDPDFLVFLEKHVPKVIDLGWTTSPTWSQSYLGALKTINEYRKEIF